MGIGIGVGVRRPGCWNKARVELTPRAAANVRVASRHGVILGGEVELHRVTSGGIDGVRGERQSIAGTNSDLMDRASCNNSRDEVKECGL